MRAVTVIAQAKGPGRGAFAERVIVQITAQTNRRPYKILVQEQIASESSLMQNP